MLLANYQTGFFFKELMIECFYAENLQLFDWRRIFEGPVCIDRLVCMNAIMCIYSKFVFSGVMSLKTSNADSLIISIYTKNRCTCEEAAGMLMQQSRMWMC